MENKTKFVILRENLWQSIVSDFFTFTFIVSSFLINERFINGNKILAVVLLLLFILFLIQKSSSKTFFDNEEAKKYIDN